MRNTSAHDLVRIALIVMAFTLVAGSTSAQEADTLKGKPPVEMTSKDLTEEPKQEPMYWHEVMGSVGYGIVNYKGRVGRPGDPYGPGVAHYTIEYRYRLFSNLTVGGALKYSPFRYELYQVESEPLAPFNHIVSLSPLIHIRTSAELNSESMILYIGPTVSHIRTYAATLYYTNEFDSTRVELAVPDIADWRFGISFGWGVETAPFIADKVRLRFFFGYQVPLGRPQLVFAAFPGSFGLGFSW